MPQRLQIAITADLHWNVRVAGDKATRLLVDFLRQRSPDLLILAGDVGAGKDFARCLELFADLPCRKALVPGNHDIWVATQDDRGDSLQVYRENLPGLSAQYGFHYLDQAPLLLHEAGLGIVGSINWYDYTWSIDALRQVLPSWEFALRHKRFSRGGHNDARFVRWPLDDGTFTTHVVETLKQHLQLAWQEVEQAIVVTHHPAFYGLNFHRPSSPLSTDGLLWDAFSGNRRLEEFLARSADRIPFTFSGHTHRARENNLAAIRGYNIGGDYHFKRLLWLDWPAAEIEAHVFGEPKP